MKSQELIELQHDLLQNIERNLPLIGKRCPMIGKAPDDFTWDYPKADGYFWTDSFFTGELWLAYMLTGEGKFRNCARMRDGHLKQILDTPLWLNHDLGFEFSLAAVADYKLTGNQEARALALRAADALRSRFNWNGHYIVAWTAGTEGKEHAQKVQGKIIIDCMQNLPLLIWAFKETGVSSYLEVAKYQAETSRKYLIREDFSTYHTLDFDTTTNEPIAGRTWQGYADESCWSRGQSWALHGFAQLYLLLGDESYLETSAKLADYVKSVITPDLVPVWDYRLPASEVQYKDSSAGAVTAAGLLALAEGLTRAGHPERATAYREFGLAMLKALRDTCDISTKQGSQGFLAHGASYVALAQHKNLPNYADAMLPYGDYYYLEAVLRAMGSSRKRG